MREMEVVFLYPKKVVNIWYSHADLYIDVIIVLSLKILEVCVVKKTKGCEVCGGVWNDQVFLNNANI